MASVIQIRRDTAANWTTANSVLAQGEMGYETDTGKAKVGDGVTAWTSLAYFVDGGGGASAINDLTDVTITTPTNGQVLKYNGSVWINDTDATGGGGGALNDLTDVTITAAATGEYLRYNGSAWVDSAIQTGDITSGMVTQHEAALTITESQISDLQSYLTTVAINDVSDITITTPADNEVLAYNGAGAWINQTAAEAGLATSAQGALADTATQPGDNISTLTNDSGFISGITTEPLSDLSDVTITTIASGEVLKWNGSAWVNNTLAEAGIQPAGSYEPADATILKDADIGVTVQGYDVDTTKNDVANIFTATQTFNGTVNYTGEIQLNGSAGTSGQVLTSQGTGVDPIWTTVAGGGGIGEFISDSIAISSDDTALANDDGTTNKNIGIGPNAGNAITSGYENVCIGNLAAAETTTGFGNVGVGPQAARYVTAGAYNVGIGNLALRGDPTTKLTGVYNVGIGHQTGASLTTGQHNILVGFNAGTTLTSGSNNICMGNGAGDNLVGASDVIAIGQGTVSGAATDSNTVAVGAYTLGELTTGVGNVGVGYFCMGGSFADTIARNTAVGYAALGDNFFRADDNTAIGYNAGINLTSGDQNTYLGSQAGDAHATGSNCTVIGYNAAASTTSVNNEFTLGNSSIATLRCQQTSITALSDARDKKDVVELDAGLDFINVLNPVRFTWDSRDGGQVDVPDTGFIAQELQEAQAITGIEIPKLVYDVNPERLEASYGTLIPAMVKAIQELSTKVNELEAQLNG